MSLPSFESAEPLQTATRPKLTGYRLLVVSTTVAFGSAKAILTSQGRKLAPTTLEWIFGIIITLLSGFSHLCRSFDNPLRHIRLIWLGWYENLRRFGSLGYLLFEKDYACDIYKAFKGGYVVSGHRSSLILHRRVNLPRSCSCTSSRPCRDDPPLHSVLLLLYKRPATVGIRSHHHHHRILISVADATDGLVHMGH